MSKQYLTTMYLPDGPLKFRYEREGDKIFNVEKFIARFDQWVPVLSKPLLYRLRRQELFEATTFEKLAKQL